MRTHFRQTTEKTGADLCGNFCLCKNVRESNPVRNLCGRAVIDCRLPTRPRAEFVTSWVCRSIAAAIIIETLFFKFTGFPESVYIFGKMILESWWRYGQGIWELIASVLLLTPRFGWAGGILTLGAMGAAIVSHLTVLGIQIQGDHGLLFAMAIVTFISGFIVTYIHRDQIPSYSPASLY